MSFCLIIRGRFYVLKLSPGTRCLTSGVLLYVPEEGTGLGYVKCKTFRVTERIYKRFLGSGQKEGVWWLGLHNITQQTTGREKDLTLRGAAVTEKKKKRLYRSCVIVYNPYIFYDLLITRGFTSVEGLLSTLKSRTFHPFWLRVK